MDTKTTSEWAVETFGKADLGDKRRTQRLVTIAQSQASHIGASTVVSCNGDEALIEGAYRFFRNEHVEATKILEAGFNACQTKALLVDNLVAVEDTTTLSYSHHVAETLGYTSNAQSGKTKGFEVHSILLLDGDSHRTVGLIEQNWWVRQQSRFGKRHDRQQRAYEEKESYKWEYASRQMGGRLGSKMSDVISVCDRESDIYDYLHFKHEQQERYVIRARSDRVLADCEEKLYETLATSRTLGEYTVNVKQKGGRKAREARCTLQAATVNIKAPSASRHLPHESLEVNAILAEEVGSKEVKKEDVLRWIILTTEDVGTFESARRALSYYELRWRIEEFHKAWKSGVGVEGLRHQEKDTLQRAASILTFIAVRLLQMRELVGYTEEQKRLSKSISCNEVLSDVEWKVLWLSQHKKKKKLPDKVPTITWAYQTIAKLGGWYDSKRTGIAGWESIWEGWFRLQERVKGFTLSQKAGVII